MAWKPNRRRRGKARQGSLASISEILDGTIGKQEAKRRTFVRTFSWWDASVAKRIARHARPVRLVKGTLIIHTSSAAWAQELSFFERDLLASVQKQIRSVKRLRIRVGPMPPAPRGPDHIEPAIDPLEVAELPGDVARALARVNDDDLRDALTKAACTSLAPTRKGDGGR